jgi:hypothetical protein
MTLSPGQKVPTEALYADLARRVQRILQLDIERAGPETTPVHRAEHLNIAHWIEPKALWDPLLYYRQQLASTLLPRPPIDEIEVAAFRRGEIGHLTLIPVTSRKRLGSCSMTSKTASLNARTSFFA